MLSPGNELLLLSLRTDCLRERSVRVRELISSGEFNWELLYDLADYHELKPQLAELLSDTVTPEEIPGNFNGRLQNALRQNLIDQLDNAKEFFRVRDALSAEGVVAVPFKGLPLAERYYGNLGARESSDTDLFIRFSDFPVIGRVMPALGYRVGAPYLGEADKRDCEYSYGLYSGGRCISFTEFHWRVAPAGFGLDITLDELAPQVITSEIQGRPARVFSHGASLLLTVMHHGGKDAFAKLKQAGDIAKILASVEETDVQWLLSTAEKHGCLSLLAVSARLASQVSGVAVPGWIEVLAGEKRIGRLAGNRIRALVCDSACRRSLRGQVDDFVFRIRSRDGFFVRTGLAWRFVRKVLLPLMVPEKMHHLFMKKYVIPDYAREFKAAD